MPTDGSYWTITGVRPRVSADDASGGTRRGRRGCAAVELRLELEGEAAVEGEGWTSSGWTGTADLAFVRDPDGHSRVELSTFRSPVSTSSPPRAPVNTPGIPRLTFAVDAVDDVLDRLRGHGAELVGEVAQYEDFYRYCYIRGPAGVIIGLVEDLHR